MSTKKITKESEIGDILYQNPWLIDPSYTIAGIKGEDPKNPKKKIVGRQVNVGKSKNSGRYIDLLLKDARNERPVIVELKKDELSRKDVGQILEYRALFLSLPDGVRKKFVMEFGYNYYYPHLILIGEDCSEETKLSANLAGVEVKVLRRKKISIIDIKAAKKKFSDYREFIYKAGTSFSERIEKINNWFNILQLACKEFVPSLEAYGNIGEMKGNWSESVLPFMDFGVRTTKQPTKYICGFYEFYFSNENDYVLEFDSNAFYGDLYIADFRDEGSDKKAQELVKTRLRNAEIRNLGLDPDKTSYTTFIPRKYLENEKRLENLFIILIKLALDLRRTYA